MQGNLTSPPTKGGGVLSFLGRGILARRCDLCGNDGNCVRIVALMQEGMLELYRCQMPKNHENSYCVKFFRRKVS